MDSFTLWVKRHHTSLTNLTNCSVVGASECKRRLMLPALPCPQLRQLHLQDCSVALGPRSLRPWSLDLPRNVLQQCTDLTTLDVQGCIVSYAATSAAAIAALPQPLGANSGWMETKTVGRF